MRYVVVRWESNGYWLDPRPYLATLPDIGAQLPPGARAFALDPSHFDFYAHRCVKDLRFQSLLLDGSGTRLLLTLAPNISKHHEGLLVEYDGVVEVRASRTSPEESGLGSVLLDELLPTATGGVQHEVALTGGSLLIECSDLTASWRSAEGLRQ
ncbi:MAG: hypothetical protein LCI03_18925 [Actinobacteria bacterium]|nr:hypothetical protein [Actinomycetota bacterium]